MKEEFIKLDAFLEFYLNEEGIFNINILQLINLIDSNFPLLTWNNNIFRILEKLKPPLQRVIKLLENDDFREIKFNLTDFEEGIFLDSPILFSKWQIVFRNIFNVLKVCCRDGKINMVKYLFETYNLQIPRYRILLNDYIRSCTANGHLEVLKYIYERFQPDLTLEDDWCIRLAAGNGHLEVVKYLREVGCDPRAINDWGLKQACLNGHLNVVRFLIEECKADPFTGDNCPIRRASKGGNLPLIKYLLSLGCDPTACDNLAIKEAGKRRHLEVVKYLREVGCNPEGSVVKAIEGIEYSISPDRLDTLKYLIEECQCSRKCDYKTLTRALKEVSGFHGRLEDVKYLCEVFDYKTESIRSAISKSCLWGKLDIVKYFVERCDYDPKDTDCLLIASEWGRIEVVRYLVEECECNPSMRDNEPIKLAICRGYLEVVKYLIEECNCVPSQCKKCIKYLCYHYRGEERRKETHNYLRGKGYNSILNLQPENEGVLE